jgi:hypothetical protein
LKVDFAMPDGPHEPGEFIRDGNCGYVVATFGRDADCPSLKTRQPLGRRARSPLCRQQDSACAVGQ